MYYTIHSDWDMMMMRLEQTPDDWALRMAMRDWLLEFEGMSKNQAKETVADIATAMGGIRGRKRAE